MAECWVINLVLDNILAFLVFKGRGGGCWCKGGACLPQLSKFSFIFHSQWSIPNWAEKSSHILPSPSPLLSHILLSFSSVLLAPLPPSALCFNNWYRIEGKSNRSGRKQAKKKKEKKEAKGRFFSLRKDKIL